jgi:hypothetical protein
MACTSYSPLSIFSNTSTIQGIVLPSALQITTTTSEIALAMHNLASPDILFTTPSASQRGGRTTTPLASCKGATTNFICIVNFTIFCPEKQQTKTKKIEVKWNPYKHNKNLAITFDTSCTGWTTFQKIGQVVKCQVFQHYSG